MTSTHSDGDIMAENQPLADEKIGREKYQRLIAAAQKETTIKVAVAHPCDDVSLHGAIEAHARAHRSDPGRPAGAHSKRSQRG